MAVSHVFSNPQANATGTLTVGYSTNTTTVAATDIVRPQDWNSVHQDYRTFTGNTAGASTWSGTNLVYSGGNNMTLSVNGNTLVFSAGAGGGGAGTGFTSTTTAGTAVAGTLSTNGLSIAVPAFVTTYDATSGRAGTGFTSTTTAGTAIVGTNSTNGLSLGVPAFVTTAALSNHSHGVTLNLTNLSGTTGGNSNGITLSLSAGNYLTTARASTDAIGLNTAGTNVTWTANSGGLSINAAGYAGTGTTTAGTNVSVSATLNSNGLNLAISGAAGGTGGGGGATLSSYAPYWPAATSTQTMGGYGTTSASAIVFPVDVLNNLHFNFMRVMLTASILTTNTSGGHTITSSWGIYSDNAGTLSAMTTSSFSMCFTGSSVSGTASYPVSTNSAGYTYTTIAWTTSGQAHSMFGTVGRRIADLVLGNSQSLSPGRYYVGIMNRQSTSGAANVGYSTALVGNPIQPLQQAAPMGEYTVSHTASTRYRFGPVGFYTSTGSAGYGGTALPTSMFMTGFNNTLNVAPLLSFMST